MCLQRSGETEQRPPVLRKPLQVLAEPQRKPFGAGIRPRNLGSVHSGAAGHEPEDGRVVVFGAKSSEETVVAADAPLLVDVEFGRGRTLFALSQGDWDGPFEGTPALPNTGALVQVDGNGTFTAVAECLDRPTSLEIINNTADVVTLGGEIWTIDNIAGPPFGRPLKSSVVTSHP